MPFRGPITAIRRGAGVTRVELVVLIAIGVALRVLWMMAVGAWTDPVDLGEATRASLAFARRGVIADAYFAGQGPTAHLLPTAVVIAGTIERLFGPESAGANLALGAWALIQVVVGFVLTTALFRRLGADRPTLLGGLALLCLLPAHIASEAADFRVWEGALGFDLAAANLLWMVTLRARATIHTRDLALAAGLAAAAFFINPPAGLAACAAWAFVAVTRFTMGQAARLALLTGLAMSVLIAPWAMRNRAVLGETVLLRSNFGLELAFANYDEALDPVSPRRAGFIHGDAVRPTPARLREAGGEVAYSRAVGANAMAWIAAHPVGFMRLSLRHYRQFYVPDTWLEDATNWDRAKRLRIRVFQIVGVLGLAGLFVGLRRRAGDHAPLAIYLAVAGLPYAVVQPIPRYGYIIYPLLVFLAVQLVLGLRSGRRGVPGRGIVTDQHQRHPTPGQGESDRICARRALGRARNPHAWLG